MSQKDQNKKTRSDLIFSNKRKKFDSCSKPVKALIWSSSLSWCSALGLGAGERDGELFVPSTSYRAMNLASRFIEVLALNQSAHILVHSFPSHTHLGACTLQRKFTESSFQSMSFQKRVNLNEKKKNNLRNQTLTIHFWENPLDASFITSNLQ